MTPLPESLLESVAAAAVREGLADALFTRLNSPLGKLLVVQGPTGIVRIAFEGEREDAVLAEVAAALGPNVIGSDRELAGERDALSGYLEGDATTLDLPVDLRLMRAPFRRAVLEELRVGPARARPSATASSPPAPATRGASRAVGTACARNPIPIVVPCHRVLPEHGQARQLRRRAGAQARAARARGSLS